MDGAGTTVSGRVVDATIEAALKTLRSPIQTQRTINAILGLCAFGIAVLALFAITLGLDRGPAFFTWSLLSALAATLGGGVLGLLFGLPSRSRIDPRANAAADDLTSGYEESTSLEQIADWLTKIIVGLTLTQFATWSAAFDRLSLTLTRDLLCPGKESCGYVPGASLVSAYFLGGFFIAYMWTRRFFILEMVARDDSVRELKHAQQQRELAAKEGRLQTGGNTIEGAATDYGGIVRSILENGRKAATGNAKKVADQLKAGSDADDPWRGVFGGSPSAKDSVLAATVTPVPGEAGNYKLEIIVTGATPERQRELAGGSALLYLHPTFGKKIMSASFGADGRASLELYAYGAFTLGALLPDGTKLELNLATLPGAPDQFKMA